VGRQFWMTYNKARLIMLGLEAFLSGFGGSSWIIPFRAPRCGRLLRKLAPRVVRMDKLVPD